MPVSLSTAPAAGTEVVDAAVTPPAPDLVRAGCVLDLVLVLVHGAVAWPRTGGGGVSWSGATKLMT
ncbi:hypothetical protein [Micromonospora sp. RTP1Z1]|uniref:hypothetical protein n=1 Tax=Micromonospora sp. RTP1Z1 TaxID=2994043 RepID=UPI0029C955C7|nr:hypothetical protein [Micromonospora sp. RTP1Z1]